MLGEVGEKRRTGRKKDEAKERAGRSESVEEGGTKREVMLGGEMRLGSNSRRERDERSRGERSREEVCVGVSMFMDERERERRVERGHKGRATLLCRTRGLRLSREGLHCFPLCLTPQRECWG